VEEATIAQVHDACGWGGSRAGLWDNAIVIINSEAAKEAAELDRRFGPTGLCTVSRPNA
jgi:hypothetical protein